MADNDDELDCQAVIRDLYTFLDGEMPDTLTADFTRHLYGCVDCHEAVAFHAELKIVISSKCRDKVPDSLRQRIAAALGLPPGPAQPLAREYGASPPALDGP